LGIMILFISLSALALFWPIQAGCRRNRHSSARRA
jgi:UDP-N-acetylglucosamine 2-epimerase